MALPCPFCSPQPHEVIDDDGPCYVMPTSDGPVGSLMVLPWAHRPTPLDLDEREWRVTQELLRRHRDRIAETLRPDGWNIGWNVQPVGGQSVDHVHCHLIPRFRDEPFAGRGIRWWFKSADNARPQ
jgi:histidine triad (HIT) family protein